MKLTFVASAAGLLASTSVNAHPALSERQSGHMVTTGSTNTGTQTRLEIRQLARNKNQWSLFVQTLAQFQTTGTTDLASYWQVAGIHGAPQQNYDGVGQCQSCGGTDGYCPHGSCLFPAWHRAYIALWEQSFLSNVAKVVATYPAGSSRNAMQAAANTLRWPYWDWAAQPPGGNVVPDLVTNQTLYNIITPTGTKSVKNPLYSYKLAAKQNLEYSPFVNWPNTIRWPTSSSSSATSQSSKLISAFASQQKSLQDRVYQMFSTCTDYNHFSNDNAGSSSTSCSTSVESIHDTVHTLSGGTSNVEGHMSYLSEAAFDPLFWLHHTNIDRFFAMWQTLNPNSYGATQNAPSDTWTIAQGSPQGPDSPLMPFRSDQTGNYWTTNKVRTWSNTFHYTYPEFADSAGDANAIKGYINNLYGPNAKAKAGSSKRDASSEDLEERSIFQPEANQYVVNIHAPRYTLGGSYAVHVFVGKPTSEDPSTWLTDPNEAGMMGVVSMQGMEGNDMIVADSITLTRALHDSRAAGHIRDLSVHSVVPYLRENLTWRIAGPAGTAVDPATVQGFQIGTFFSTTSPLASLLHLPTWSEFIPLPNITSGRHAGATAESSIFHL